MKFVILPEDDEFHHSILLLNDEDYIVACINIVENKPIWNFVEAPNIYDEDNKYTNYSESFETYEEAFESIV